jgi:hypothetical protein
MRFYHIFPVLMAVSGCAAIPQNPNTHEISTRDIVQAVQCELAAGYVTDRLKFKTLDKFAAAVDLELKVTDTILGESGVNFTIPHTGNILKVHGGASYSDKSYRYQKIGFQVRFDELGAKYLTLNDPQNKQIEVCNRATTGFSAANKTLGLTQWLVEALEAVNANDDASSVVKLGYILEFTLIRKADGSIGIITSRVDSSKLGLSLDNKKEHVLNVAVAKIDKYEPWEAAPQRISTPKRSKTKKQDLPKETQDKLQDQLLQNRINSSVSPSQRAIQFIQ